MTDFNQQYFDAALRRQIDVRRYTQAQVAAMLSLLESADAKLVSLLRQKLGAIVSRADGVDFTSARMKSLLLEMRQARAEVMGEARALLRQQLKGLATTEAEFEQQLLAISLPFEHAVAEVGTEVLRTLVTQQPFQGRNLSQWFQSLAQADQRALVDAVQIGLSQGDDVDTIVRAVVGTRANQFTDGALSMTRRNAEAVVRTAINHVSNASREAVWDANEDIILALRWTSVLDGRTSAICRGRDGCLSPIGDKPLPEGFPMLQPPDARPPAHVSCRSIMVAVLDALGIVGDRPYVVDNSGGDDEEIDFAEIAKDRDISVKEARDQWATKSIGTVPAATTYNDWLARQSSSFQDQVLGKTKAKLFRTGEIKLDQFLDRQGNELTLDELASQKPGVFRDAGLDPADF